MKKGIMRNYSLIYWEEEYKYKGPKLNENETEAILTL